jgi:hypothetical protein
MPKFRHSLDAVGSASMCEVVERLTRVPIGVQLSDFGFSVGEPCGSATKDTTTWMTQR